MPQRDHLHRAAAEFFRRHIRDACSLENIAALDAVLPDDIAFRRELQNVCQREARRALHAGFHLDGRRLNVLAFQLQERHVPTRPR